MSAADVVIWTRPQSPVVDGRVLGSIFHGDPPLKVTRDGYLGIYVLCRACRAAVAVDQPNVATAADRGRQHLADVDHSPEAVKAGAR